MQALFSLLLSASLWGGVLCIAVLFVGRLCRRNVTPNWHYYIWLVVLLRFLLPISIAVPIPYWINTPNSETIAIHTMTETNVVVETGATNSGPYANEAAYMEIPYGHGETGVEALSSNYQQTLPNIAPFLAAIWLSGAVLLFLKIPLTYIRHQRYLGKNCFPATDNMEKALAAICRESGYPAHIRLLAGEGVRSPFATGFLRPTIVLPYKQYDEHDLAFILRHELTHIRRHDLFIKLAAEIAKAVHWFNPFVYIMARQIDYRCEAACDYAVANDIPFEEKKRYSLAIVNSVGSAIGKEAPLSLAASYNKKTLTGRINAILTHESVKRNMPAAFIFTAVLVLFCACTGIKASNKNNTAETQQAAATENRAVNDNHTAIVEEVSKVVKANVLIASMDSYGQSDMIMVAGLDTEKNTLTLLSVPRDMYVEPASALITKSAGNEERKLPDAIKLGRVPVYAGNEEGMTYLKSEVEKLLGIQIDYTMSVNMDGFEKIIDAYGGIEMDVPQDMVYNDPMQNLSIDIKKGKQVLDGETALQLVRYRLYENGDEGRNQMQRQLVQVLYDKVMTTGSIEDTVTKLLPFILSETDTDITMKDAAAYLPYLKKLKADSLVLLPLPVIPATENYMNFYHLDEKAFAEISGLLR